MIPARHGESGGSAAVFDRLNRVVVGLASVAAVVFFVVLVTTWLTTGDGEIGLRALSPAAVGATGGIMLLLGRPNAVVHLGVGMASLIAHVSWLDPDSTETAIIGLVAMAIAGALFLRSRRIMYTVALGSAIFVAGMWWGPDTVPGNERAAVAVGPAILFVFLTWIVVWLRDQLVARSEEYRNLFRRYHQLFHNAPIPLWEIDFRAAVDWLREVPDGVIDLDAYLDEHPDVLDQLVRRVRVTGVNQAALDLLGVASMSELIPQLLDHNLETAKGTLRAQLVAAWNGETETTVEYPVVSVDGRRLETVIRTAIDAGANGSQLQIIASSADVTAQKETENRLEELIRSKDDFVATVSHELRTPLTAVVGLSAELRDRLPDFDEQEVRDFASIIAGESQEVADIVEDLLVAARADLGALVLQNQAIDVGHEARTAAATTLPDTDVVVEGDGLIRAMGDPGRVRQIVRNLVVNARRYGGPVIRICCRTAGDLAFVEVRDNGAEVSQEGRRRMFDPYQQLHTTQGLPGSVGLGLTVSLSLARLMGGDLTYHHDGAESVFTLSLPLISATEAARQPA